MKVPLDRIYSYGQRNNIRQRSQTENVQNKNHLQCDTIRIAGFVSSVAKFCAIHAVCLQIDQITYE